MNKTIPMLLTAAMLLSFSAHAETVEPTEIPEISDDGSVQIEEATEEAGYKELNYRDKGDAVRKLQENLNALGYDCGTADGQFGSKTRLAVSDFQRRNGLEVSGVADEATQIAIESPDAVKAIVLPEIYVSNLVKNGDRLAVSVSNDSKETVTSVTCVYMTLNPDGTLSSNCGHPGDIAYFDQEAWSFEWQLGEDIEPGATIAAADDSFIDPKLHYTIAAGVKAYTTASGKTVSFAYEQIPFRTNIGETIYPAEEDTPIRSITAEDLAAAQEIKYGYTYRTIPYYAASNYLLSAGQYVTGVESGSLAEQAGIKPGDLIVSFSGDPSTKPYAAEYAKLRMKQGENVFVEYVRNNESVITFFTMNTAAPYADAVVRYESLLQNNYITQEEYNVLVRAVYGVEN